MHLFESVFSLRKPIMLAAFEGWNDAGESATGAINHLLASWTHHKLGMMDPEEYYDFQVNRPSIKVDEKVVREIIWPNTILFEVSTPHLENDFLIVKGIEPSMKWRTFASELLDIADDYEVSMSITLGALLSDTPHTRPITVTGSGAHPDVADRLGIDAVSLWASVPHYVSTPPCPKASLALINSLEDFLEISIPQGDLPERASAWETQVNQMAAEDSEVGDYVKQLETSKDAADLPEATGESIAREVERFLRRNPGI
jgi:proteasome assembly chaperone (PAC2) family protein